MQVEVGHDGEGRHAAWHLAWLRITNLDTAETATFQCNRYCFFVHPNQSNQRPKIKAGVTLTGWSIGPSSSLIVRCEWQARMQGWQNSCLHCNGSLAASR